MHDETCIIVLGTHRSGTSCTAGVLHTMGINMGEPGFHAPDNRNPKGFFEDTRLVNAHKHIISDLGLNFDVAPIATLPVKNYEVMEEYVDQRIEEATYSVWGVKDPRLCHVLPYLVEELDRRGVSHRVVCVHRPVSEIANSLRKAGDKPVHADETARILCRKLRAARNWYLKGYARRLRPGDTRHNSAPAPYPLCDVQFHDLLSNPAQMSQSLSMFILDQDVPYSVAMEVDRFVDPTLAGNTTL